jgi:hypothetical protein
VQDRSFVDAYGAGRNEDIRRERDGALNRRDGIGCVTGHFQRSADITPGRAILNETVSLGGLFITTAIFARAERRSFAEYGRPARGDSLPRVIRGTGDLDGYRWGETRRGRDSREE